MIIPFSHPETDRWRFERAERVRRLDVGEVAALATFRARPPVDAAALAENRALVAHLEGP